MLELHRHLGHEKDRPGKAAHRIAQELAFNLVYQHIPAPSILDRLLDVPLTLFCILHLIEQSDMMIPICASSSCTIDPNCSDRRERGGDEREIIRAVLFYKRNFQ
jgi:hypothetical protein